MKTKIIFDLVVLGLSPTGLYAVREAGRAGYSVLGVGAPGAPGLASRFLTERIEAVTPEERLEAILARIPKNSLQKPLLIVTSDQDLDVVISNSNTLSQHVIMQDSYLNGLAEKILDKDIFYQLCEENGTSFPRLQTVTIDKAKFFRSEISFPAMIKPARIQDVKHLMAGQKGWIVKTKSDFDDILPRIPRESGTLLIQEIVPGSESNITLWCGYIDRQGKVRQRFTARKIRQYPAGFGSASLVQSEVCSDTSKIAENMLCKLGYRGIAAAEFKLDSETGELKIIEINPRPSLWFSVATASGIPLIETALAEAQKKDFPPQEKQKNGMIWRYTIKDIISKGFYLVKRNFVLPPPDLSKKAQVMGHANVTFAWDDPLPALSELVNYLRKFTKRL